MTLKAHFDGKQIVLDEPLPPGLAPNTPVQVVFPNGPATGSAPPSTFEKLLALAGEDDLPADYAQNHEHYVKGAPKR
jgi:hypothetical protein